MKPYSLQLFNEITNYINHTIKQAISRKYFLSIVNPKIKKLQVEPEPQSTKNCR